MKYYTRIEKHKDRSMNSIEEPLTYEAQPPRHFHLWWFLTALGVLAIILSLGIYVAFTSSRVCLPPQAMGNELSQSIVQSEPELIPAFSGLDYVELNNNIPMFSTIDAELIVGEYYSPLDNLGRCGVVYANIDQSMRPTEERGSIGMIKPSGWCQAKYEGYVDSKPPYLYNRCHLIAYALTAQNANELNLITGTRYFNVSAMLPFEEQVMKYLDHSDNHVLYRVTPYFMNDELVARGVEIEALSVEDSGGGICFHVFVYNYQPGVEIDYRSGESWIK